jgi:hypothetical protein
MEVRVSHFRSLNLTIVAQVPMRSPVQQLRLAQFFEGEQFGWQNESPRQLT